MAKIKAYAPHQKNLEERINHVLGGNELSLAIEGRYTNLRIWKSRLHPKFNPDDSDGVYMRLDRANQYSAPLSPETLKYIENENSPVHQLAEFGFPTSIENLRKILEITENMPIRECIAW